ncbi:hypothetical protein BpHYR1_052507 [Brachionus plicatilis]|uniref:Uncharacterized protein n=1 Tax=Brachionus plicatilis TaxID=10195 RepID=A0A3M7Q4E5_BRAPC|nr:hypothetical protein BpHYR1_052507 [Brachionus plicatilis]
MHRHISLCYVLCHDTIIKFNFKILDRLLDALKINSLYMFDVSYSRMVCVLVMQAEDRGFKIH